MNLEFLYSKGKFIERGRQVIEDFCIKNGVTKGLSIGLSGGSTPIPIYQEFAKQDLPFEKIHFYQVDERYVPADHPDSNRKLIEENLLAEIEGEKPEFHYFDTALPIEESLEKYEKELPENGLDLCILGIGPDGHTASLFPGCEDFEGKTAHTQTKEFAVKDRLTITFPEILKSKKLLVLVSGENKEQIIAELRQPTKSPEKLPALNLLKHPNLHVLYHK